MVGVLFIFFLIFIFLLGLSGLALFMLSVPMSRGLGLLFTKRYPWSRKTYIIVPFSLVLTASGTYIAQFFIVFKERIRLEALDPFPGGMAILLMKEVIHAVFILLAISLGLHMLRKTFRETDKLNPKRYFDVISVLIVLSFYSFIQVMIFL